LERGTRYAFDGTEGAALSGQCIAHFASATSTSVPSSTRCPT
jgi:hypothetical protein